MQDWPVAGFVVPIQLDPNQTYQWAAFVDYDPTNPMPESFITSDSRQASSAGGIVPVAIPITTPPPRIQDGLCHRIDFVVADVLWTSAPLIQDPHDLMLLHTPGAAEGDAGVGGDSVSWWYTGGSGVSVCPTLGYAALPEGGFAPPDGP